MVSQSLLRLPLSKPIPLLALLSSKLRAKVFSVNNTSNLQHCLSSLRIDTLPTKRTLPRPLQRLVDVFGLDYPPSGEDLVDWERPFGLFELAIGGSWECDAVASM